MKDLILSKLHEIETTENVRILLAVESGSRAWGFASPDSDYDVRFIYVRPREDYLKLNEVRDVIELPINDVLDINGWDLQKALRLMFRSNPTLFEWLMSPIVYIDSPEADQLRNMMVQYFSPKRSMYHYISMARNNYREFLREDLVKAKKYFYVLRPILACRWILDRQTPPPVLFSELMDAELPDEFLSVVQKLLDLKMNSPEVKKIPPVLELNIWLTNSMDELHAMLDEMQDTCEKEWEPLNQFFLAQT